MCEQLIEYRSEQEYLALTTKMLFAQTDAHRDAAQGSTSVQSRRRLGFDTFDAVEHACTCTLELTVDQGGEVVDPYQFAQRFD